MSCLNNLTLRYDYTVLQLPCWICYYMTENTNVCHLAVFFLFNIVIHTQVTVQPPVLKKFKKYILIKEMLLLWMDQSMVDYMNHISRLKYQNTHMRTSRSLSTQRTDNVLHMCCATDFSDYEMQKCRLLNKETQC